jgi:hypothetical protein
MALKEQKALQSYYEFAVMYCLDYLLQDEPFTFESSETQKEEILMTGSLQKMHAQLRRLRNDSSILKDAYITAIPNHKSKVTTKLHITLSLKVKACQI